MWSPLLFAQQHSRVIASVLMLIPPSIWLDYVWIMLQLNKHDVCIAALEPPYHHIVGKHNTQIIIEIQNPKLSFQLMWAILIRQNREHIPLTLKTCRTQHNYNVYHIICMYISSCDFPGNGVVSSTTHRHSTLHTHRHFVVGVFEYVRQSENCKTQTFYPIFATT